MSARVNEDRISEAIYGVGIRPCFQKHIYNINMTVGRSAGKKRLILIVSRINGDPSFKHPSNNGSLAAPGSIKQFTYHLVSPAWCRPVGVERPDEAARIAMCDKLGRWIDATYSPFPYHPQW